MNEKLSITEKQLLDHLELRESKSSWRLSQDMNMPHKGVKKTLASLEEKQYAINYGGDDRYSLWCAL